MPLAPKILEAKFLLGASSYDGLPKYSEIEVAFVGRSNVGKSTLINTFTGEKNLARVSSTPGRTQEINFFKVKYLDEKRKKGEFCLVDLPGFGYAKIPGTKRHELSELLKQYLTSRENLKLLCLLNDIRREPEADELAVQRYAFEQEIPLIMIATKSDKVPKNDLQKNIKRFAKEYHLEPQDILIGGPNFNGVELLKRILFLIER